MRRIGAAHTVHLRALDQPGLFQQKSNSLRCGSILLGMISRDFYELDVFSTHNNAGVDTLNTAIQLLYMTGGIKHYGSTIRRKHALPSHFVNSTVQTRSIRDRIGNAA